MSFYFFLITHSDVNQLIHDRKQQKILGDRFKHAEIELAEGTAFELMAQALLIEPDTKAEWENISRELWESVKRDAVNFIIKRDASIKPDDLRKLLPMHPYAACLLKTLAPQVSSNQRTMFQFLCAEDDNNNNFKHFIDTHGFEYGGDNFLTADFLWDYFFRDDNPDLNETFREALGHYNNFCGSCQNENQLRVLKTTLILFALQQKNVGGRGGATSLLRSTRKNICVCFAGTPLENEVLPTLNYFADRGIVSALEESDDVHYIMANTQVDAERMEKILEQMRREKTFDAIIGDNTYDVAKSFKPTDFLKYRLDVRIISPTKFLQSTHANFHAEDNRIMAFYIFAADEDEQGKVAQTIQKIFELFPERCIAADFSGTPFTRQRYEKFIRNKAREFYFKDVPNQAGQVKLAKKSAADLVDEWARQFAVATVRVWSSAVDSSQVSGASNFLKLLRELNEKFFGGGLETLSINDKLFSSTGLTENVAKLALNGERIKGNMSWLNALGDPFRELVTRSGKNYWTTCPTHTLSKMKTVVENVVEHGFAQKNEVAFVDIWHALKKSPVGLLKCPGSIFLLTLLLKDFADKNFYVRDCNNNTGLLTGERLGNLVVNTVKELPTVRDRVLVKQTPEHVKFCRVTADIFGLPADKINSVDDAAKNLKIRLAHGRYPLWALKSFVEEKFNAPFKPQLLSLLNLFGEFVNPQGGRDVTKIADEIFSLYNQSFAVVDELKAVVREENFKAGMTMFIANHKPALKKIVGRLKLTDAEYLSRLNEKLSADSAYLWRLDDVTRQIDKLFDELRLIEAINSVLSEPTKNLSEAGRALGDKLNRIKVPRVVVEHFFPSLKDVLQVFVDIRNNNVKDFVSATEQISTSAEQFNDFFANQSQIFFKASTQFVDGTIDSRTADKLCRDTPAGNFFKARDEFVLLMKSRLAKFRHDEKSEELFAAWREVTDTNSPADWSNQNAMPILCAFSDCRDEAQLYFSALNGTARLPNESSLDAALTFIRGEKISRLADKNFCTREFVKYFCGENYSVVFDADSLREILRRRAGNNAYGWFSRKEVCDAAIKARAAEIYSQKFLPTVRKKIRELSAEDAQNYLAELIEKDALLGIRVYEKSVRRRDD